jgi:NAD-dependent deacetylase sirtuin 2
MRRRLEHSLPVSRLDAFAEQMRRCSASEVVVLLGAGASTNAGIPDFRSPETGLYANIKRFNLPYPEAIFDLEYFARDPRPFYSLCREMWPGRFYPTAAHRFVRTLQDRGLLLRCYTQNIDGLESLAGIADDKLVCAHGSFEDAHCISSGRRVPIAELRHALLEQEGDAGWQALRERYGGLVKPSIVFFGENLPRRFFSLSSADFPRCRVLITMGTSLAVQPFGSLVREVKKGTPRLLINRERVGDSEEDSGSSMLSSVWGGAAGSFRFGDAASNDVFLQCDIDAGVSKLVAHLGWDGV